jgi:D-alanyl-lipoteichoic acid acyltransferase DltB (MBOAT superfamily)
MPFNTFTYFLFLTVVFLLHYITPDKFRWLVLLGASFSFYAALRAPHLIVVLLLVTTMTYLTGIWINRKEGLRIKQFLLWGGISANVLTLILLKYLPFINQNLKFVLNLISPGRVVPVNKTIIAIGASYFIFQAISYLIDIYLGIEKPERHFGRFALYMAFFPKLLQGPIERGGDLLPQLKVPYVFNYENVHKGMLLFGIGLVKKVVIADRLALLANPPFDNVYAYKGISLLLASYYYSLQIYFDFSGYTDMALGTAMMFNIKLTQNFNNPYFATSIADFWRRWHISFSRWILDYIFKPLQMSWRNWGDWGVAVALLVTFTISGIWHGARWGFVCWGILHGLYLAASIFYKKWQKAMYCHTGINPKSKWVSCCRIFIVFNMVCVGWILFRVNSISDAIYVFKQILFIPAEVYCSSLTDVIGGKLNISSGLGLHFIIIIALLSVLLFYIDLRYNDLCNMFIKFNFICKSLLAYVVIVIIVLFGYYDGKEFIYNAF